MTNSDQNNLIRQLTEFNKSQDGTTELEFFETEIINSIAQMYGQYEQILRKSAEDKQNYIKQLIQNGVHESDLKRAQVIVGMEIAAIKWLLLKAKLKLTKTNKNN